MNVEATANSFTCLCCGAVACRFSIFVEQLQILPPSLRNSLKVKPLYLPATLLNSVVECVNTAWILTAIIIV